MINDLDIVQWAYLLDPAFQIVNTAGKPLTDGWIEVYIHGTRNKYYCASDFDGTLHPFKIPLDSLGANIVLASPDYAYDIYIYNKFGSLVMSRYNVVAGKGGGGSGGIPSQTEAQHWLGQYGATQALEGNERGQTLALPSRPDYQGDFVDHIDYGTINGDEVNQYPKYMYLKPGLYLVNCVIRFQQQSGTEVNRLDETLVYTGNGNANEDIAWQLDETGPLATGDRHCLKLTFIRKVLDEGETSPVDCNNILYFAPAPQVNWSDAYIQTLQVVKLNSAVQGGGTQQLLKPGPGISIDDENEISVTGMQPVSGMNQYVTVINFNDYITEVTEVINNVTGDIINIQNEIEQVSASVSAIVPEYQEGYGIIIEGDTISVDPSIIPSGCVSQEELAQVTGDIVNQIENVTGDVTEITNIVNNVTGDITNLTEVVNNVTGDVTNLTEIVEGATGDITNIITEISNVTGDIVNINENVTNLTEVVEGVTGDVTNITNIIEGVTGDISDIEGDITNITNVVNNVTGDVTNLTEVVNNVTGDVTNLTEVVNNVTGDVHNLTEVVNGVTGDIEQLNTDIQAVSAALPDAQVQSDWDESNPDSKAFILNKPDLDVYATKDEVGSATAVLQSEIEAVTGNPLEQVQSDWTQVDDTKVDYIKNKPDETEVIAGRGISIVESGSTVTISATGQATVEDLAQVNADIQTVSAAIPDISNLATKDEVNAVEHDVQVVSSAIPDISNLATKDSVQAVADDVQTVSAAIPDISNLATKDEVQSVEDDVQTVSAAIPDISNLATKDEVNAVENDLQTVSAAVDSVSASIPESEEVEFEELDLSKFAQASAVTALEGQIETVSSAIPDVSDFVTHGELAAVTGDYATNEDLQTVSAAIPDISNLATESEVQFVSGAIEAVSAGIPAAQVQSDWAQTATGEPDYIKNKPTETPLIAGENIVIEDVQNGIQISATVPPVTGFATEEDLQTVSAAIPDISNLATKDEVQAVADDVQTVSAAIPDISNLATKTELDSAIDAATGMIPDVSNLASTSEVQAVADDLQTVSAAIPDPQVNADWNATSGVAEILNKPEVVEMSIANIIAGDNVSITASGDDYVISASGGSDYTAGQYISIENNEIAVTGLQPAGDYATNADLQTVSGAIPDVSNLATESDLQTVSAAVDSVSASIPESEEVEFEELDLSQFASQSAVTALEADIQTVSSAIPDVSNLATEAELQTVSAAIPDVSDLATKQELEAVSAAVPEAQVNADWDAVSGKAEILNKPAEVNLIAGSNITITESGANLVISSTGGAVTGDYVTYPELAAVTGDVAHIASDIQTVSGAVNEVSGKIPESEEVEFEELEVLDMGVSQLIAGDNITITASGDDYVISAQGGGGGPVTGDYATHAEVAQVAADVQTVSAAIPDVSNLATNAALQTVSGAVDEVSGMIPESEDVEFEELEVLDMDVSHLIAGDNISITASGDDYVVSATVPDVSNFATQTYVQNYTIPVQVVGSSAAATGADILYIVTGE